MKLYHIQYGVVRAKYILNYHDGKKTHKDGSPFFDIMIFRSRDKMYEEIKRLRLLGYREGIK